MTNINITLDFIDYIIKKQKKENISYNVIEVFSNDSILNYDETFNILTNKKTNKRFINKIFNSCIKLKILYNYKFKYDILKNSHVNMFLDQNNNKIILNQKTCTNYDFKLYVYAIIDYIENMYE